MTVREFIKIGDKKVSYYIFDEDANMLDAMDYSTIDAPFIDTTSEIINWEIDRRFDNCINIYIKTRE